MPRVDPEMARVESVFPEALKSVRRQSRVTDGRIDRCWIARVSWAVVCELIAAGMPQHVAVNEEGEAPRPRQPARSCADNRQRLGVPGAH